MNFSPRFCFVFGRRHAKTFFEISVETPQRDEPAFEGTLQGGKITVFQKIAGVVQAVVVDVGIKGEPDCIFEIA